MNKEQTNELRRRVDVMKAWLDGRHVQSRNRDWKDTDDWVPCILATWNWETCDYRIAPDQPTAPDPGESTTEDSIDRIRESLCDPKSPLYGSDLVPLIADLCDAIEKPEPAPQWHDDAPPTVEEVGEREHCLVTWGNECIGLIEGRDARMHWHFHTSPCVIAWSYKPEPYRPAYTPPITWQRTADRPPTEADGVVCDNRKRAVMATRTNGDPVTVYWEFVAESPDIYPEWIYIPALLSACRGDK